MHFQQTNFPFTNETISYGTVSAASSASDFDYISPGLYSSEGFTGEVPYMGWSFFTVACSELALTVTVHVNVSLGAVSLYERAAQSGFVALPSRGHHDYFVHDDDADGLDVTSLRERLERAGLDVDGSREMLVERWKQQLERSSCVVKG